MQQSTPYLSFRGIGKTFPGVKALTDISFDCYAGQVHALMGENGEMCIRDSSTADVKIIMLTVHTENPLPAKVMQAGAAGYLSKGAAPQEVVSAIRSVYSGQRYIASDIAQQMALSQIEPEKTESPFASLSERELQIMLMITKGQKVNEISEQLNLSPKTVNSYRYRMFSKLLSLIHIYT